MIKPIGNNIVLRDIDAQTKTSSGFFLTSNQKVEFFEVCAVGDTETDIKLGTKVVIRSYSATEVTLDKIKYFIVSKEDILSIVEEDAVS